MEGNAMCRELPVRSLTAVRDRDGKSSGGVQEARASNCTHAHCRGSDCGIISANIQAFTLGFSREQHCPASHTSPSPTERQTFCPET
uniref:Uncharacterized protein n=1 Tax=Knipowitschia caucasica TaxID=637954 RepID=A0AAV2J9P9_KNICA